MAAKYVYRIDDITEDMNWDVFNRYIEAFKKHWVKPLLGVVPDNKDYILKVDKVNPCFWEVIRELKNNGFVEIAQHGYQHLYNSMGDSILKSKYGYAAKSEFSGLDYSVQHEKLRKGKEILYNNGVDSDIFMAPGHSFDRITVKVLADLGFKYITDGIGLTPYYIDNIKLLPVQYGELRRFPLSVGIITICMHINKVNQEHINRLERHIVENKENIITFGEAVQYKECKIINRLFGIVFLTLRYIKAKLIY